MALELHDCPHCATLGVLPMSDGKCPNCKWPLAQGNECRPNTSDLGASPEHQDASSWRDREQKHHKAAVHRTLWISILMIGAAQILLSLMILIGMMITYDERDGTRWQFMHEVTNPAAIWAAAFLVVGWVFFEVGFGLSRIRLVVQILIRALVYSLIGLMFLAFALIAFINLLPDGGL